MKIRIQCRRTSSLAWQCCALGGSLSLSLLIPTSLPSGHAALAANLGRNSSNCQFAHGIALGPEAFVASRSLVQSFQLNQPKAVAVDQMGNLYIADTDNDRVLMRTPSGQMSVILARPFLNRPAGVAVEPTGYLYIADTGNDRILCKAPTGPAMICVSGFLKQPTALALDAMSNLYMADTVNGRVMRRTPRGEICIVRTEALDHPMGVTTDARYVYVSDFGNNRILRRNLGCDASDSLMVGMWNQPIGLIINGAGDLFIAESANNVILRRSLSGETTRFAGGGTQACTISGVPAISAMLNRPTGMTIDSAGNLYFTDTGNNCIRRIDARGIITTVL